MGRICDVARILVEHARVVFKFTRCELSLTSGELVLWYEQIDSVSDSINSDAIAILHESDGTSIESFRHDVTDDKTMRSAREATVCDKTS